MNVNKTEAFCSGKVIPSEANIKYLCSEHEKGVGRNSILCAGSPKWVHKRCSCTRSSLSTVKNFKCKRFCGVVVGNPIEVKVNIGGDEN